MNLFTVIIDTNNAAFTDSGGTELAALLSGIAEQLAYTERGDIRKQVLRDSNGNTVGYWQWAVT